jgi:soluble lytic murein transglycosylase-like protein
MNLSSVLLAAAVLAVRAHAQAPENYLAAPSPALLALEALQAPGLEFGRMFDSAAENAARLGAPAAESAAPAGGAAVARLMRRPGRDRYDALIRAEAADAGLDPRLVKAVVAAESEFSARARSRAGALGLMQVMPATADSVGVPGRRLLDPAANVRAGTRYLAYLFARAWERFHLKGVPFARAPAWLLRRVIAAYNAGPRWISQRPAYRQTRAYVRKVLAFYSSSVSELGAAARAGAK